MIIAFGCSALMVDSAMKKKSVIDLKGDSSMTVRSSVKENKSFKGHITKQSILPRPLICIYTSTALICNSRFDCVWFTGKKFVFIVTILKPIWREKFQCGIHFGFLIMSIVENLQSFDNGLLLFRNHHSTIDLTRRSQHWD